MKQSRVMSMLESFINVAFGFGVAIAAQLLIFPLFGFNPPLSHNLLIGAAFTVISIIRSYVLRRFFEFVHIRHPLSPGALAIVAERRRQIDVEGWTPEHDDKHSDGELAQAGAAYAINAALAAKGYERAGESWKQQNRMAPTFWPWSRSWWKPQDFRRDLVRAGALIIAELDRDIRNRKSKPVFVGGGPTIKPTSKRVARRVA